MYEFAERFMTDMDVFFGTIVGGFSIIVCVFIMIMSIFAGRVNDDE